ncbi:carbon-nitrogen hydrolase [Xylaria arbuscula]|nr:carbon-nitrogen hydrolase [Xylaria arbuscula]
MRIGCLQFAPQVGDIDDNLSRADAVLSRADPENLDLLVLPELAFAGMIIRNFLRATIIRRPYTHLLDLSSGYNFKSLQEISPFLEPQGSGISALWARTVALRLNCVVTVGYAEKEDEDSKWPTSPEYYNSVIVVNTDGEPITNYRKSFLFYTDETWALEGGGFYGGSIPQFGNTAMGICMDINPYKFEAPWHAFEFAFHCLEVEANLVIVTMAWMTREDASVFSSTPNEPDMDTLTYWMARLEPLIRSDKQEEIIVIFCNRAGIERDTVYAGTSTVIGIKDGEVNVYGLLGRGEEKLLVVDTEQPPLAKLVYSPDDQGSTAVPVNESSSVHGKTGQGDYDQSAPTKPPSIQPSPKNITKGETESNAAQGQALPEEARFLDQPHPTVSELSRSSCQSHSNERSCSSRSSQNPESGQEPQPTRACREATSPRLGVTKNSHSAPLVLIRAQGDRSMTPMHGEVSARDPFQFHSYENVPRIQISSLPIKTGIVSTSSSLAGRSKSSISNNTKAQSYTSLEVSIGQSEWACGMHVSAQGLNEVTTPTSTYDDVKPRSPNVSFWALSDTLLNIPMEPRPWTPARADSPTLSMETYIISQA